MKNLVFTLITFVLIMFLCSSCSQRILDFTIVSSKNVELSKANTFVRGNMRVSKNDVSYIIILAPVGQINIKEAMDRAIESYTGCVALLDGVIRTKSFYIPFIFGRSAAIVEGTPLVDPQFVSDVENMLNYRKIELDKRGEIHKVETISARDYYAFKEKLIDESKEIKFANSKEIQ